jgi:hypothetical protein
MRYKLLQVEKLVVTSASVKVSWNTGDVYSVSSSPLTATFNAVKTDFLHII